ncbi:hypothetical protein M1771_02820 [Spiroplasma citri]|uniref:Adhesin P123 n=1 Tax=Spiroplasma citri TaxID=2133 RepID=A0AAX3T135_SPICI|nr:hypothetical protein [Spiroplasma citri]APE74454.1 hypothetical protein SCITRI_00555 [Spiroplasma citri]WFG96963.1 hypothetical protein M0C40_02825 [Spiroplasma citri]WFH00862.1 hypothetical protein M1771_02820 [Spiroplasma citri]
MNLFVEASPTSTLLIEPAKVEVKNSKNYDPNNVYNLSKVRFRNQSYNFPDFSPSQLRIWIEEWVAKGIAVYQYPITLNADYGISANGIPDEDPISHNNTPGDLNYAILTEFIDNTEHNKELELIVYSNNASDLTKDYTEFKLLNNIDSSKPPVDPTDPIDPTDPTDSDNPSHPIVPIQPGEEEINSNTKKYLAWILPAVIIPLMGGEITIAIIIIRKRKRIR